MSDPGQRHVFAWKFASAVAMQATLSATSFIVGLILIRRAASQQYGYYILILNLISLLVGVQNTFIYPQMVLRMLRTDAHGRADLIGGLFRVQLRLWPAFAVIAIGATFLLQRLAFVPWSTVWVMLAAIIAILASLYREFFRMVLLAYRRPEETLKADAVYAAMLIVGALIATLTPAPAAVTALMLGVAALVGGLLCSRMLWSHEGWNIDGAPGIFRDIAPHGVWSTTGTAIHWLLSQGYNFLVAATLSVTAVAALGATRLLVMPVNLLSTGIGTLMLPTATTWLQARGVSSVLRRLLLIAAALSAIALCYFAALWVVRDWVFTRLLQKQLVQRDALMLLWFGVALLMVLRDQLIHLLLARARYPVLTLLTFVSAVVALITCYVCMLRFGAVGALIGVLLGELVNVCGLLLLSVLEIRATLVEQAAVG